MSVNDALPLPPERQVDAGSEHALGAGAQPGSLYEMREDFRFFTPALLMTHGHFDRDPVMEFIAFHGNDAAGGPFVIDAPQPFFCGLPPTLLGAPPHGKLVNWDNRLYAVHKDTWEDCCNFIAGITVIDKDRNFVGRFGYYGLSVTDVTHCGAGGITTDFVTIDVTVFGLDGSDGRVYLSPPIALPVDRPYVVRDKPTVEALALLQRMRQHDFAPVGYFANQPLELPNERRHGSETPGRPDER